MYMEAEFAMKERPCKYAEKLSLSSEKTVFVTEDTPYVFNNTEKEFSIYGSQTTYFHYQDFFL